MHSSFVPFTWQSSSSDESPSGQSSSLSSRRIIYYQKKHLFSQKNLLWISKRTAVCIRQMQIASSDEFIFQFHALRKLKKLRLTTSPRNMNTVSISALKFIVRACDIRATHFIISWWAIIFTITPPFFRKTIEFFFRYLHNQITGIIVEIKLTMNPYNKLLYCRISIERQAIQCKLFPYLDNPFRHYRLGNQDLRGKKKEKKLNFVEFYPKKIKYNLFSSLTRITMIGFIDALSRCALKMAWITIADCFIMTIMTMFNAWKKSDINSIVTFFPLQSHR